MSGINDREKGFENKFAHDQELVERQLITVVGGGISADSRG